jgi:hypothetical protein
MKKLILLLLISIIFLSGCINDNETTVEPLKITLDSDLTTVRSNDTTYLYLTLDNLDKDEEYNIDTKVMNTGILEVLEYPKSTTLAGLEKKTLEWRLGTPIVSTETTSSVGIEVHISKKYTFKLPIIFANPDYLKKREQGGNPVPKKPKTYTFSDNLVSVTVNLNKEPPIDSDKTAYANIEAVPKIGTLKLIALSTDEGKCEKDKFNRGSCQFWVNPKNVNEIQEKRFSVTLEYEIKSTMSVDFTILPEIGEGATPSNVPEEPSGFIFRNRDGKDVNYDIIKSKSFDDYDIFVIGFNGMAPNPTIEMKNKEGGSSHYNINSIDAVSSEKFCKLVGMLEFSSYTSEFDCLNSGFCIIHPSKKFCGIGNEDYRNYLHSIGLISDGEFKGSLLYKYSPNQWCYIKDENVGCDEIESKFEGECLSGEFLRDYINIYSPGSGECYDESKIKWYFSGRITEEDSILNYDCISLNLNSPSNTKYYKPYNCKKTNEDWKRDFDKYDHLLYLKIPKSVESVIIQIGV